MAARSVLPHGKAKDKVQKETPGRWCVTDHQVESGSSSTRPDTIHNDLLYGHISVN